MIILQDTREKLPWDFGFYGYEQKVHSLKTGDYTLQGYEDVLCIERKCTTSEISINFGSKSESFGRELERLKEFKHRFLICEFTLDNVAEFPKNSGIPWYKMKYIKMNANFLLSRFKKLETDYGITVIFAGDKSNAELEAIEIFQKVSDGFNPKE